ncbi:hypothetical protein BX600DRAFT_259358 [Xylariales sp. PMI_506]|nr:hypothetical protein BX600DRAFT_259358 [Xylariales sp. PMI_506]
MAPRDGIGQPGPPASTCGQKKPKVNTEMRAAHTTPPSAGPPHASCTNHEQPHIASCYSRNQCQLIWITRVCRTTAISVPLVHFFCVYWRQAVLPYPVVWSRFPLTAHPVRFHLWTGDHQALASRPTPLAPLSREVPVGLSPVLDVKQNPFYCPLPFL